jgi:hypothetical protein
MGRVSVLHWVGLRLINPAPHPADALGRAGGGARDGVNAAPTTAIHPAGRGRFALLVARRLGDERQGPLPTAWRFAGFFASCRGGWCAKG